jgi:hypothetical protein
MKIEFRPIKSLEMKNSGTAQICLFPTAEISADFNIIKGSFWLQPKVEHRAASSSISNTNIQREFSEFLRFLHV